MSIPEEILKAAKVYANDMSKQKYSLAQGIMSPGLWFGYVEGAMRGKPVYTEDDFKRKDKDGNIIRGKGGEVYFMSIGEILKVING